MKNLIERLVSLSDEKFEEIWQHYVAKNAGKILKEFPAELEAAKNKKNQTAKPAKPVDSELLQLVNSAEGK